MSLLEKSSSKVIITQSDIEQEPDVEMDQRNPMVIIHDFGVKMECEDDVVEEDSHVVQEHSPAQSSPIGQHQTPHPASIPVNYPRRSMILDHGAILPTHNFTCARCSFYAATLLQLRTHVKRMHAPPPLRRQCNLCNYSASDPSRLRWHKETMHEVRLSLMIYSLIFCHYSVFLCLQIGKYKGGVPVPHFFFTLFGLPAKCPKNHPVFLKFLQ